MPPGENGWSLEEFHEIRQVVQNFVNQNTEVIECDPLVDWLHEVKFMLNENSFHSHRG